PRVLPVGPTPGSACLAASRLTPGVYVTPPHALGASTLMFTISYIMYIDFDSGEARIAMPVVRHKHVQLDQRKLERARRALGARTETETLERALDLVLAEADIDAALRRARGTGGIRRVFR
ncbi:MAG: hypothetical protein ACRELA_07075, partial [Candidatus Rokuibacteriota bacterium]